MKECPISQADFALGRHGQREPAWAFEFGIADQSQAWQAGERWAMFVVEIRDLVAEGAREAVPLREVGLDAAGAGVGTQMMMPETVQKHVGRVVPANALGMADGSHQAYLVYPAE